MTPCRSSERAEELLHPHPPLSWGRGGDLTLVEQLETYKLRPSSVHAEGKGGSHGVLPKGGILIGA